MKALLAKKLGMTQIFADGDKLTPVTVLEAGPCVVTQVKTPEKDGYSAVKLGFVDLEDKKVTKPQKGQFAKSKIKPKRFMAEVKVDQAADYKVGDTFKADVFAPGDKTDVTGISKGKGFAGVIKRWGFHGGPAGHGSHFHRAPGSIGASATPSRVKKGTRLPGHLGVQQVTVKNLEVVKVDPDQNLVLVKGAVPGARGALVMIKK